MDNLDSRTHLRKPCRTRWRPVIGGMVAWSLESGRFRLDMIKTSSNNNSIGRRTAWPVTCSMCTLKGAASSTSAMSSLQSSSGTSRYQCRGLRSQPNAKASNLGSSATMQSPTLLIRSLSRLRRRKTSSRQPPLPIKTRPIGGLKMLTSCLKIKSSSNRQLVQTCRVAGRPSQPDYSRAVEGTTPQ